MSACLYWFIHVQKYTHAYYTHIHIYMATREVKLRGLRPPKYKQNRARPNRTPKTIIKTSTATMKKK